MAPLAQTTGEPLSRQRGTRPAVTIIVPVHGDRGRLAVTMRALQRQDYAGPFIVVVVDNGDNEDLGRSVESLVGNVHVIAESQRGSYAARNAGVRASSSEVVAFTDGDCVPRPDWLRRAVEALVSAGEDSFVGGAINVFPSDSARPTNAELWDCVNGLRQATYVLEDGWAATANMVTYRKNFDSVGLFRSELQSGGDREWGQRASAAGLRAVFSKQAVVDHPARKTLTDLHKKARRVTQGMVDARMAAQLRLTEPGWWASNSRPNTRSIIRRSNDVSMDWTIPRVRYVLTAHWLQYYFAVSHLRAVRRRRKRSS